MTDNLKTFEKISDYQTYKTSAEYVTPSVSLIEENNAVVFDEYIQPPTEKYLTFVALEDTTFTLSNNAISYSLDDGETWTVLAAAHPSPTVTAGNKIMWKGNLTPNSSNGIGTFSSTGRFNVEGNIMSLLYADNSEGKMILSGKDYAFSRLFYNNTKIVSAKDLSLPATTLVNACYSTMFDGCSSLTTAPELPATRLTSRCYQNMFQGCTNLNYIKAMFTTTPSTNYTNNWVSGVAASGTFVKNSAATWNVTGVYGVPTGWTVQTASTGASGGNGK